MAIPYFHNSSTSSKGTAAITIAMPSTPADGWQIGDLFLVAVETAYQTSTITPSGGTWTQIGSMVGTGTPGAAGSVGISLWWCVADAGVGSVTTNDSGDHQVGNSYLIRNVNPTTPINSGSLATSTVTSATTTADLLGTTTSSDICLVVQVIANTTDSNTAQFGGTLSNASVTSITQIENVNVNTGTGGGYAIIVADKYTAGTVNTTTGGTLATSSVQALVTFALNQYISPSKAYVIT